MLDIATTPSASASVHALTGSSRPGAVPPLVQLGTSALGLGAACAGAAHPDAEVIDLAERVKALARRDHRIWDRRAAIEDAVDAKLPALPLRPDMPARGSLQEVEADGMRITTITMPTAPDAAYEAALAAYEAAVSEALHMEAEMSARLGLPRWEKLSKRTFARLVRWTERLAQLRPQTEAGLKAKVEVQGVLSATGNDGDWTTAFSSAVGRDATRIATALAGAGRPDAALLALAPMWEASAARCDAITEELDAATDRLGALSFPAPEALFWTEQDTTRARPYGTEHVASGRRWFGEASSIEALRQGYPKDLSDERRAEIIGAYETWQDQKWAAGETTGFVAAKAADEEAGKESRDLRRKILRMPARTVDGILLKARVARWCFMDDEDEIVRHLASEAKDSAAAGETAAFSILLDLARMVGTVTATAAPPASTMCNLRPVPLPSGLSGIALLAAEKAGDVREWYRSWLVSELRLLNIELDGNPETSAVWQNNPGADFHFPPAMDWRDVPKPSTRAAAVLGLLGILPAHGAEDASLPAASAA